MVELNFLISKIQIIQHSFSGLWDQARLFSPPECLTEICLYRYLFAVETELCYLCLCLVSRHTDRSEQENSKGLGTSLDYHFLQFKITYIYLFSVYMHIKRSENTWGSKFVSFYCEGLRL